jgi:hypothetical protein
MIMIMIGEVWLNWLRIEVEATLRLCAHFEVEATLRSWRYWSSITCGMIMIGRVPLSIICRA